MGNPDRNRDHRYNSPCLNPSDSQKTSQVISTLKPTLVVASLAGYALAPAFIFYFVSNPGLLIHEKVKDSAPLIAPKALPRPRENVPSSELPVRITIPKAQVNAPVEQVALTTEGAVDIPKGPQVAAWFNKGPRPGEEGSAVIVGHFGWRDGIAAVFDNLDALEKGDTVSIEGEKGAVNTFVVRESRTYGQNESAPDVFISSDNKAHLNLITCRGTWSSDQKSYSNRLVVFTDRQ